MPMIGTADFTQIRKDIVGRANSLWTAEYPAVPMEFENSNKIDPATFRDPYVCVDIVLGNATTFSIGANPIMRLYGSVLFHVNAPEHTGMNTTYDFLGFLTRTMTYKSLPSCYLQTPKIFPSQPVDGWTTTSMAISFYADIASA